MYPLSMHSLYFSLVPSPTEADFFQKMITVSVVPCQDGAVKFSDKIQDFPTDLK
jgi:hypothetical protein